MAIITLSTNVDAKVPDTQERKFNHWVDLETGNAGRWGDGQTMSPAALNSILFVNIPSLASRKIKISRRLSTLPSGARRTNFDLIDFGHVHYDRTTAPNQSAEDLVYESLPLDSFGDLQDGQPVILQTTAAHGHPRYFKVLVRHLDQNLGRAVLLYEELVQNRAIIPVNLILNREADPGTGVLDISNPDDPESLVSSTLDLDRRELLWTIRDDPGETPLDGGPAAPQPTERDFYDVLYPIVKIEFFRKDEPGQVLTQARKNARKREFQRRPPGFVANFTLKTIASRSYLDSTLLLRVSQEYLDRHSGQEPECFGYDVVVLGGVSLTTVSWDPEVVIDPH